MVGLSAPHDFPAAGMFEEETAMRLATLMAALLVSLTGPVFSGPEKDPVLFEDFESPPFLIDHPLVEAAEGKGIDGGTALRVAYEGYERGSRRVVRQIPLGERGDEYTLVYDVRFGEDFQFVRGGKLHGLGPSSPITGGNPVRPGGWSARVTFAAGGRLRTYIYNQDQPGQWGTSATSGDFRLEKGRYYSISFHVKLNEPGEANGFAHVYVDGERVIEHEALRYRGEEGGHTLMDRMLFSTFHGGSSPAWAPVEEEGGYVTVHACFDNFAVHRGKHIRSRDGRDVEADQGS